MTHRESTNCQYTFKRFDTFFDTSQVDKLHGTLSITFSYTVMTWPSFGLGIPRKNNQSSLWTFSTFETRNSRKGFFLIFHRKPLQRKKINLLCNIVSLFLFDQKVNFPFYKKKCWNFFLFSKIEMHLVSCLILIAISSLLRYG